MQTLKYFRNIITEQKTFYVNIRNKLPKVQGREEYSFQIVENYQRCLTQIIGCPI